MKQFVKIMQLMSVLIYLFCLSVMGNEKLIENLELRIENELPTLNSDIRYETGQLYVTNDFAILFNLRV